MGVIGKRVRAGIVVLAMLGGCGQSPDAPPVDASSDRRDATTERAAADAGLERPPSDVSSSDVLADSAASDADAGSDSALACATHFDCLQGSYCYKGACATDPLTPVFHLGKAGCPPGHWCVSPTGTQTRCAADPGYSCNDACDCGPAHCCVDIAGVGKRCVRDLGDPWLPAPPGTSTIYNATCPAGAPTYCCSAAECHAAKATYGPTTGFLCYDKSTQTAQSVCGGKSCQATACHCQSGESCVDTVTAGAPAGKACGQLTGGSCVSNAIAEAVFGWKASELLPCCTQSCPSGQRCDRGWRSDGQYAFSRIVGVCGGTCGNGSCDFGETPTSCAADCTVTHSGNAVCAEVWSKPSMCGDGVCQATGVCDWNEAESCRTCPEDCGACRWKVVHGQGGVTALSADMFALWGPGPNNVYAVGSSGAIVRWDGRRWTPQTSGVTVRLYGVWGSSDSDVFAVAESGAILHYDGTRWSAMTSNVTRPLLGVWGSAAADVFAVGNNGTVAHYDGQSWSATTIATRTLRAVWGSGAGDVFAVGDGGTIMHYDGSGWSAMNAGAPYSLYAVWGSSATNVYAASGAGKILRYDGQSWSVVYSAPISFQSITGTSASNVIAVGQLGDLVRFNGITWRHSQHPVSTRLHDVWASGGEVFIAGSEGTLLHDSGSGLVDTGSGIADELSGVWKASTGEVFSVGQRGRVVHFDGTRWTSQRMGTTSHLRGVWGSSASDVYVAGQSGVMMHYDGTRWTKLTSNSSEFLHSVWGSGANDIYVAGFKGTLLHSSGSGFSPLSISSNDQLTGVWGTSASDVYVVGQRDLLHYDGTQWTVSSVTPGQAHFLWGLSATDFYLVDLFAGVSRYDGASASFVPILTTTPRSYQGIWGTSASDLTVVGVAFGGPASAFMDHYDGATWRFARVDLREVGALSCRRLYAIGDGYAVGDNELVLQRVP
ncbi:MAG: hypothetical protein KC503_31845 [Myxococcales bacterium]|nr:hypothetical protein [Myxococcales bacterium]